LTLDISWTRLQSLFELPPGGMEWGGAMKKILIIVGIVLAVVIAAGAILVSNLDRVVASRKDALLAQAQERIGREVTVGDIKVGVWPGIGVSLEDVAVADDPAFSAEPFARVADLRVNVKLMPLLRKKVEVKRLVLRDAVVSLITDENGVRNIDSMIPSGDSSSGDAAPAAAAIPLVLAFADIEDGTLRYVDRAAGIDHTVRDLDFTARDVSLETEMSFELSAAMVSPEADVRLSGKAGPIGEFATRAALADVPVDVAVTVGPVAIDAIRSALPPGPALDRLGAVDPTSVEVSLAVRGTLGDLRVEDLVARAALLGSDEPNLSVRIAASGINPLGGLDVGSVSLTGSIEAGPLPLASLREVAGTAGVAPQELSMDGTLAANASFDGTAGVFDIEGSIDVTDGSLTFGESFRKPSGVPARASIRGHYRQPRLEVEEVILSLHDLRVRGSGTVAAEHVDMTLSVDESDVSKLAAMLPALSPLAPTGTFSLDAKVAGSAARGARPDVEGNITLENGGAKLEQLPEPIHGANASVAFTGTTANVEVASLKVGRSSIAASVRVGRFEPLEATYRISSERIWRNDFQVPTGPASPRPEVLDNVVATGRVWHSPQATAGAPVDHEGTVTSARGVVANLDYTDLRAKTRSDGDDIVIESFSANSLDGTVGGSGRVQPTAVPPRFDVRTEVKQVDLAKYFQHKFPTMSNVIEGRIDLNVNLVGSGKTWEEISTTLEGDGGAVVIRGALLSVNLANELIAGIQSLPLVPADLDERMRAKHPRLFSGNSTAFENLDGEFRIDGGRITTDDLFLKAADFAVTGDGWFAFDRTLNLKTRFVFSEALSRDIVGELPIARYLQNAEGRIVLPLVLRGDVVKPSIVPDSDAITAALQRGAVDGGTNRLQDEIKDRLGEGVKDLFGGLRKKDKKAEKPDTSSSGP
jgi:uncharacterized protein involved in outer membrane biogenesis